MSSLDEVLNERLDAFLIARGATREKVVSDVADAFGSPLLVVATGSVLQGFSNQQSDLDLNVVVDYGVTRLPLPSHRHGFLIDATYFDASEAKAWVSRPPLAGEITRDQWRRYATELKYCTRFRDGVVLSARDSWDRWMSEFRKPGLVSRVAGWWRVESLRRWCAARWLADLKPLLAAQRGFEAVLAVLENRAATHGQVYFGPKWLPEKLRALNDREGLEVLHAFQKAPLTEPEAREYNERCEAYLMQCSDRPNEQALVQLWYLRGVKVRELASGVLVSRWNLRAIELGPATPRIPDPHRPIWEGEFDTTPPADVLRLFISDMTWLSIMTRPA
jgi:hypothetical protein